MKKNLKKLLAVFLGCLLCMNTFEPSVYATTTIKSGLDIEGELGEKTAEQKEVPGEYEVTVAVPGTSNTEQYAEIIIMADASDSINDSGNWPHFKNMVNALGNSLLSDYTSLKLTLMGFGIGAKHAGTFTTTNELNAFMDKATSEDFLQERSATNCEVGFKFVDEYIDQSENIDKTYVIYLSDARANMTEKLFDISNWSTYYTKTNLSYLVTSEVYNILEGSEPLDVTKTLFPEVCSDLIILRDKYNVDPYSINEEIINAKAKLLEKNEEYGEAITQAAFDISSVSINEGCSASQLEKIFQTYFRTTVGKNNPLYNDFMDFFYICFLMPMNRDMPDDNLRAAQASLVLQNNEKVLGLYHVCYSSNFNNWMSPVYVASNYDFNYTEKVKYLYGANFGEAITSLENEIENITSTIYKNVTITDPMSEWVTLEPETIAIYDGDKKIYQYGDGENTGWLIDNPPVVDEIGGGPADPIKLTLNEKGLYQITWLVKTGNLLISDQYSLKYTVRLNKEADGYVAGTSYPLNDPTTVSYIDENGDEVKKDIPVPQGVTYQVEYEYISGTPNMELPDDFVPVPVDTNSYSNEDSVIAKDPETLEFIDEKNDGVWTFKAWDEDTKTIDGENIKFVGEWVFTANSYTADYKYVSGTPNIELPDDFVPIPVDTNSYSNEDSVIAKDPETLEFIDEKNDGVWTFNDWDEDIKTINKENITFIGEWIFTANLSTNTGDNNNILLWSSLIAISSIVMISILLNNRRNYIK